jgi:hypothetical protein
MNTDLAYLHQSFLNDITNEVITNINMLGFGGLLSPKVLKNITDRMFLV